MCIKFYSVQDVADKFGRDYRTILRWIREGTLGASKIEKTIVVTEDDLNLLLIKNRVQMVRQDELVTQKVKKQKRDG